jgi:hypothetical protein
VSSTITGTGGALTGITRPLTPTGSTGGNDRLFVDDAATTTDVIGVLTDLSLVGVGMTLGGSGALGNLVQVLSVLGAADGRFTIGIAGVGTTSTSTPGAATVQQPEALLGAGNVPSPRRRSRPCPSRRLRCRGLGQGDDDRDLTWSDHRHLHPALRP